MRLISLSQRHLFTALLLGGALISEAQAALIVSHVTDKNKQSAADAVIFAKPLDTPLPAAKNTTVAVAQEKATFIPYVTVIRTGTLVRFPNNDSFDHHVKSFSPAKTFEARVNAKKEGPTPMAFDKTGEIALTCFFHDFMRGFIYVVDTPYFAKTDKAGNAVLNDLPVGKYEIYAWAPSMIGPPLTKTVQVPADGSVNVEFQFDFVPKPAPAPKLPAKENVNY
ncbi:MAG: methylamine utilization protein [Pseudomonadota bacterium]